MSDIQIVGGRQPQKGMSVSLDGGSVSMDTSGLATENTLNSVDGNTAATNDVLGVADASDAPTIVEKLESIRDRVGEVQASPTSNTLLARLKDLLTGIVLATGSNAIGKLAANSGVDIGDVDVTSISAGSNLIGDVGIQPRTSGGLSMFRSIDLDETEEDVKTSAGQIFGYYFYNAATSARFIKVYNATATNVTVGTTTPVLTIPLPAGAAANFLSPIGITFDTAITVACTTGVADNDTGAPGANDVIVNIYYK